MVTRSRPKDGSDNLSPRFAFVSICTVGLLLLGLPAQAQRQVLETRSAAPPKARPVGQLSTTQELNLALTRPLRNEVQLQFLIQQLYDPSSPEYRRFMTVEQFTDQCGPTAADYDEVIAFASTSGYVFRLNSSKTVKSITLPNNPDVLVPAATLLAD